MTSKPHRPIRFGLQVSPEPQAVAAAAVEAEAAGFDVVSVADHIGPNLLEPMTALAVMAASTSRIGLGTLVLNNDMRNPVQVAWAAATLQRISGGRLELGLGAGHTPHEYAATGITFDPPPVRKRRLAEAVEIIGGLLRGETVSVAGEHYTIEDAAIEAGGEPPRILVGGNGDALLQHAARHADIIGLQGLGRTKADGHRHSVKFGIGHLERQIETITAAAAADRPGPELNALVQMTEVTADREAAAAPLVERADGLTMADALATPYLAFGTVDELAAQFIDASRRWGISYFTLRSLKLAPVIAKVRELEPG